MLLIYLHVQDVAIHANCLEKIMKQSTEVIMCMLLQQQHICIGLYIRSFMTICYLDSFSGCKGTGFLPYPQSPIYGILHTKRLGLLAICLNLHPLWGCPVPSEGCFSGT